MKIIRSYGHSIQPAHSHSERLNDFYFQFLHYAPRRTLSAGERGDWGEKHICKQFPFHCCSHSKTEWQKHELSYENECDADSICLESFLIRKLFKKIINFSPFNSRSVPGHWEILTTLVKLEYGGNGLKSIADGKCSSMLMICKYTN